MNLHPLQAPSIGAGDEHRTVDPASFAALSSIELADCLNVEVVIDTRCMPGAARCSMELTASGWLIDTLGSLDALSRITLSRIPSLRSLKRVLLYAQATYDDAIKAWTCASGILVGLRGVTWEKPLALLVENPLPTTVIRGAFVNSNAPLERLRRYLFGADKKMVRLIDGNTLRSPVFFTPPLRDPLTEAMWGSQRMLEEDEVRLRRLFPALSDFAMLSFP